MKYIVTVLLLCAFAVPALGQQHRGAVKKKARVEAQECEQCKKVCTAANEVAALKKQVAELKRQVEGMRARMQKGRPEGRTPPGRASGRRGRGGDWSDALQRDGIIPPTFPLRDVDKLESVEQFLRKADKLDPEEMKKALKERMGPEALKRFEDMRKKYADREKIG